MTYEEIKSLNTNSVIVSSYNTYMFIEHIYVDFPDRKVIVGAKLARFTTEKIYKEDLVRCRKEIMYLHDLRKAEIINDVLEV